MPIAFPPKCRCTVLTDASKLSTVRSVQVVPKLMQVSEMRKARPFQRVVQNVQQLGTTYSAVTANAIINPVVRTVTNNRVYRRNLSNLRNFLSGVTRDATEATLGSCQVMIFSTVDKLFIGETTSDGSGAWSMWVTLGWPFFRVVYKAGAPDVAGTSRNDIVPIIA